ncbi:MAG: hypothetical protein HY293_01975 [Planctomycetes bacterium]|nr:hypothetical protein [Planctomycetota bacterium]
MIQFTCPSCKGGCSVDDKFTKRKMRCPRCGARVLHVEGSQVQLLTPGTPPAPGAPPAPAPPPPPAGAPPGDATPIATAAVPHAVGEFVRQSESQQNTMVVIGLGVLFTLVLSGGGLMLHIPLLAALPICVALVAATVWLLLRRKRLQSQLKPKQPL